MAPGEPQGRDQAVYTVFAGVGRSQIGSPAVAPGPRTFGRITPLGARPTEATGPAIAEEIPACIGAREGGLCGLLHFDLA
jgi:hypothetical protein